jgi:antitoxin (DNA-binding transcriptional repressor) of toxin-antitoxin stability system
VAEWQECDEATRHLEIVASCSYNEPTMKTVGVRELKNRLSEYLREVRSGEHLLVTDRGEVVAEFSPPGEVRADASIPSGLLALARRSVVTMGAPGGASVYKALPRRRRGKFTAAKLLDEERGS